MGTYDINIHGGRVTAHTADNAAVVDEHIAKLHLSGLKVVGIDLKDKLDRSPLSRELGVYCPLIVVLYAGSHCLIIHSDIYNRATVCQGLTKLSFLEIPQRRVHRPLYPVPSVAGLTLAEIAQEVGVPYGGLPTGVGFGIELDKSNPKVMTEEQVELAVSDSVAYYRIGFELLSSIVTPT